MSLLLLSIKFYLSSSSLVDFALVGNIITNAVIPSSTILQIASVSLTSEKKKNSTPIVSWDGIKRYKISAASSKSFSEIKIN